MSHALDAIIYNNSENRLKYLYHKHVITINDNSTGQ